MSRWWCDYRKEYYERPWFNCITTYTGPSPDHARCGFRRPDGSFDLERIDRVKARIYGIREVQEKRIKAKKAKFPKILK